MDHQGSLEDKKPQDDEPRNVTTGPDESNDEEGEDGKESGVESVHTNTIPFLLLHVNSCGDPQRERPN